MSQKITISSITANTPVDVYYCDSMSANCVYVATVELFPYTFYVQPPYDEKDILIKIIDNQNITISKFIEITPTPTPNITASPTLTPTPTVTIGLSPTPTNTQTPSNTATQTPTPSITKTSTPTVTLTPTMFPTRTALPTNTPTQSYTPTNTPTNTQTPTLTLTPTSTSVFSLHEIGRTVYISSYDSCKDTMTATEYFTYKNEADTLPIIGVKMYSISYGGVLYNPINGNNGWYKTKWGNDYYSVKIDEYGAIIDFVICS
jgi:hypothetical protein